MQISEKQLDELEKIAEYAANNGARTRALSVVEDIRRAHIAKSFKGDRITVARKLGSKENPTIHESQAEKLDDFWCIAPALSSKPYMGKGEVKEFASKRELIHISSGLGCGCTGSRTHIVHLHKKIKDLDVDFTDAETMRKSPDWDKLISIFRENRR